MKINSCCCCISLRTGCIALSVILIVASVWQFGSNVWDLISSTKDVGSDLVKCGISIVILTFAVLLYVGAYMVSSLYYLIYFLSINKIQFFTAQEEAPNSLPCSRSCGDCPVIIYYVFLHMVRVVSRRKNHTSHCARFNCDHCNNW